MVRLSDSIGITNMATAVSACVERDGVVEHASVDESEYDSEEEYTDADDYSSGGEDSSYIVRHLLIKDFRPALDAHKQRMIERTLSSLAYVLPTSPTSVRSCAGTDSSGGSQQKGNAEKVVKSGSTGGVQHDNSKRDKGNPQRGGDEDGNGRRERTLANTAASSNSPKLACPFYKRDPEKYSHIRSCVGPGWDSVHRLK
jgi:hypothetical protein